jgi:hypothetical protein
MTPNRKEEKIPELFAMFKKNATHLKFLVVMTFVVLMVAHAAPTGLRHRNQLRIAPKSVQLIGTPKSQAKASSSNEKTSTSAATVQQQQCPTGNGFNYYSHTPYCTINYKCAVAMQEFSTPCGCGCQPKKCGGSNGACPATHVCKKGACFLK